MRRRAACVLCSVAIGVLAVSAGAQHSHDPLAHARAKAKAENQLVLVCLTGGEGAVEAALADALNDYRSLGKLLRYEYQLAALPGRSQPGEELRSRLKIGDLALPALAVLDTEATVLESLSADGMVEGGAFSVALVRAFLEKHKCEPLHARDVLADAVAEAKRSQRDAFVYLSAPW